MSLDPGPVADRPALVWDWPLRAFHWTLVLAVATSFATHYAGIEWFDWHRRAGYVTLVLVVFRIAWGFAGTRYARFGSFVRSPRALLAYLRDAGSVPAAGHNPLGGVAVLAFLVTLSLQATTGLFANDEIANAGPFYGWIGQETSNRVTALHATGSKVLLGLVALHLLALAWHDLVRRRGLVRAFWTGRRAGAAGIESSRGGRAVAIVVLLVLALALAIRAAPEATVSLF